MVHFILQPFEGKKEEKVAFTKLLKIRYFRFILFTLILFKFAEEISGSLKRVRRKGH